MANLPRIQKPLTEHRKEAKRVQQAHCKMQTQEGGDPNLGGRVGQRRGAFL